MSLDDEKRSRLETSHAADPLACEWGVLTTDPWPSGLQMFHWYASPGELKESLLSGDHALDTSAEDCEGIQRALLPVLDVEDPFAIARLEDGNHAASPGFVILWWGSFDELCSGASEKAREVREEFLSRGNDEYDWDAEPRSIRDDERRDFAEFLREWGV